MLKSVRVLCMGLLLWCGLAAAQTGGPSASEALLIGTWYGEYAPGPGAPVQRHVTTRRADGTFSLQARLYEPGKPPSDVLVNNGLWGVSNGLYFTVTTEVNGGRTDSRNPEIVNSYLVRDLQRNAFTYQHVLSGTELKVTRVPPETQLP